MKKHSLKYKMLLLTGLFPLSAMAHSAGAEHGAAITLTSILIAVVVFVLLYFALSFAANCRTKIVHESSTSEHGSVSVSGLTDNELAAISIALYKYSKGLRESENSARLMNKTAKANSAWTLRRYTHSKPVVRRK
jgi:small-conductance mechanosensitive channel